MNQPSQENCYGLNAEEYCPLLAYRDGPKGKWVCTKMQFPNTPGCLKALIDYNEALSKKAIIR